MRWFVEVSRVGESDPAEKYCVEAKAWQAALQEARRLRGDSGPLSKFSIELLDQGYRAVDAELKIRYFVNNAPADAPLTESNGSNSKRPLSVAPPKPARAKLASVRPPAVVDAAAIPLVSKVPSQPPPAASISAAPSSAAEAPKLANATQAKSGIPRPGPTAAPRPRSVPPAQPNIIVPSDPVPRAPRLPTVSEVELNAAPPPLAAAVPAPAVAVPAPAVAAPAVAAPVPAVAAPAPVVAVAAPVVAVAVPAVAVPVPAVAVAAPAVAVPVPAVAVPVPAAPARALPAFEVIRERGEEPKPESPITYREVALAVEPRTTRQEAEALLWARYRALSETIADRTAGKFIQLAVFDHVFKKKPERPPLATLAWKDWRGDPVLAFPGFGEPPAGPLSGVPSSHTPSTLPTGVAPLAPQITNHVAVAAAPAAAAPAAAVPVAAAPVAAAPVAAVPVPPAPIAAAPTVTEPGAFPAAPVVIAPAAVIAAPVPVAPVAEPVAAAPPAPSPVVSAEPLSAAEAHALGTAPTVLNLPVVAAAAPVPERQSRPRIAPRRRAPGEDLIGDLFETMHDLHFLRDIAVGSDFVLTVLNEVLPCEGVLLHVFDINSGNFVVVRAKGARDVLLSRLSDQDPLCTVVMRGLGALSLPDVSKDARFAAPRWELAGITPRAALCGAVRQGGRYLGMVELVNPLGDTPFHQGEINALDYICEQYAEFLANRPIVLEADMILPR